MQMVLIKSALEQESDGPPVLFGFAEGSFQVKGNTVHLMTLAVRHALLGPEPGDSRTVPMARTEQGESWRPE